MFQVRRKCSLLEERREAQSQALAWGRARRQEVRREVEILRKDLALTVSSLTPHTLRDLGRIVSETWVGGGLVYLTAAISHLCFVWSLQKRMLTGYLSLVKSVCSCFFRRVVMESSKPSLRK